MWRFYLAATAIVAVFLFLVTMQRGSPPDLRISAKSTGTPSPARPEASESARQEQVGGEAPWALSALPECAHQDRQARGPWAQIHAMIPAGARRVDRDLRAGTCAIRLVAAGILVTRGEDRLLIPAPAELLRFGDRYYLYRKLGDRAELREYTLAR